MRKGIIFDMDGTLWDSAEPVAASWNEVLEKEHTIEKRITKQDMYSVMGKTMDLIADILFPNIEQKRREKLLFECCKNENLYLQEHGGVLYPDIENMLLALKDEYDLYIVSNCQKGYIESFLEYYGFAHYFKDMECYGNNGFKKGKNIKLLVERNGNFPAVYVGDIQGDYDASKEAGVAFIHAAYGFGTIDEKVPVIQKPMDLPGVMQEFLW